MNKIHYMQQKCSGYSLNCLHLGWNLKSTRKAQFRDWYNLFQTAKYLGGKFPEHNLSVFKTLFLFILKSFIRVRAIGI